MEKFGTERGNGGCVRGKQHRVLWADDLVKDKN